MQSPLNASNRKVVLASTACGAAGGAARSRFGRDAPIGTPGPISKMSARKLVSEAIQTVTECSGTALLADGGLDALALHRLGDAAATLTRAAELSARDQSLLLDRAIELHDVASVPGATEGDALRSAAEAGLVASRLAACVVPARQEDPLQCARAKVEISMNAAALCRRCDQDGKALEAMRLAGKAALEAVVALDKTPWDVDGSKAVATQVCDAMTTWVEQACRSGPGGLCEPMEATVAILRAAADPWLGITIGTQVSRAGLTSLGAAEVTEGAAALSAALGKVAEVADLACSLKCAGKASAGKDLYHEVLIKSTVLYLEKGFVDEAGSCLRQLESAPEDVRGGHDVLILKYQLAVARRAIAEAVGLLDDLTGAPGFEDRHLMMAVEELLGNLDDVPDGLLSDIIAKAMRRAQNRAACAVQLSELLLSGSLTQRAEDAALGLLSDPQVLASLARDGPNVALRERTFEVLWARGAKLFRDGA